MENLQESFGDLVVSPSEPEAEQQNAEQEQQITNYVPVNDYEPEPMDLITLDEQFKEHTGALQIQMSSGNFNQQMQTVVTQRNSSVMQEQFDFLYKQMVTINPQFNVFPELDTIIRDTLLKPPSGAHNTARKLKVTYCFTHCLYVYSYDIQM